MPWKETGVVNLRTEFVLKALSGEGTFEELCREYGISRKTGYKWKERFQAEGIGGLEDQSRRPQRSPSQASEDLVCELVRLKQAHPSWGPRKIRVVYGRVHPGAELPSESTCKRILEKAGLVVHRRRRAQATSGRLSQRVTAERANQVWTVDFKGWWRTGDHRRFEPLTVRDAYSRYILSANGSHERMHRDLALEVEGWSSADVVSQQAALEVWRQTYNHERPHEAIGMRVPAKLYAPSSRKYDAEGVCVEYPLGYLRRRVTHNGTIGLHGVKVQISEALCGQEVGLEPQGERYALWFCRLRLGEIDVSLEKFTAATGVVAANESVAAEPVEVEQLPAAERAGQ